MTNDPSIKSRVEEGINYANAIEGKKSFYHRKFVSGEEGRIHKEARIKTMRNERAIKTKPRSFCDEKLFEKRIRN